MTTENWTPKPARGEEDHPHRERPPFTDGNLAALRSGYRSPRIVGEVAERIADDLLAAVPIAGAYPEELASVATLEAVLALMRADVSARGIHNADGSLRGAFLDRLFAAERQAAKARDRLGLSPMSEASIARERAVATTLAVDLHEIARRGQVALDARTPGDFVAEVLDEARATYESERASAATTSATANDPTERKATHDHA